MDRYDYKAVHDICMVRCNTGFIISVQLSVMSFQIKLIGSSRLFRPFSTGCTSQRASPDSPSPQKEECVWGHNSTASFLVCSLFLNFLWKHLLVDHTATAVSLWGDGLHVVGAQNLNPVTIWVLNEGQALHFTWNTDKEVSEKEKYRIHERGGDVEKKWTKRKKKKSEKVKKQEWVSEREI